MQLINNNSSFVISIYWVITHSHQIFFIDSHKLQMETFNMLWQNCQQLREQWQQPAISITDLQLSQYLPPSPINGHKTKRNMKMEGTQARRKGFGQSRKAQLWVGQQCPRPGPTQQRAIHLFNISSYSGFFSSNKIPSSTCILIRKCIYLGQKTVLLDPFPSLASVANIFQCYTHSYFL